MRHLQRVAVAGAFGLALLPAGGDETDVMFEALFAQQIRAAKGTREHADDLKVAEEMVLTVRSTEISAALTVRICEQAYGLAATAPGGSDVALAAMRLLAAKVPPKRPEARKKITKILLRAYGAARGDDRKRISATIVGECEAAGDSLARAGNWQAAAEQYALAGRHASEASARERLKRKYTAAAFNARIAAEMARLTARVKSNPRDRSARERLVWSYMVQRDSPAEAANWLTDDCSEDLRHLVPLAAGKLTALTAEDCAALGRWYVGQSSKTENPARVALLVRARRYARMYEAAQGLDERSKAEARRTVERIESYLKRLGRADLLTDEAVPTPETQAARARRAEREGSSVGASRLGGPSKGLVLTTGYGRSFEKSVRVRGNVTMGRHGVMTFKKGAVMTRVGSELYKACKRSNELTIAAIITPDNVRQGGSARIITFSSTDDSRNFTLGQEGHSLVFRLRTTSNGTNGTNHVPTLCTLRSDRPHCVVVTYQRGLLNCYVDGRHVMKTDKIRGDFGNWDNRQTLMFGDERSTRRYWRGTIHAVRIYSRALSANEAAKLSGAR